MKLTRKEFLQGTLAVAGGAALAATAACGGDDDGGGGGGSSTSCGTTIDANHGHSLSVPKADVDAGTDKTYSIKGSSAHDHQILVTAAHFASLKAGKEVFVTSTDTAQHNHNVSVKCA
jgi:hypothetical protein